MTRRNRIRPLRFVSLLSFLLLALGIAPARADQSQLINAKLETRAVNQNLESSVQQLAAESTQPTWIAYEVQATASNHSQCCGEFRNGHPESCGVCNLEQRHGNTFVDDEQNKTVKLEAQPEVTILLRVDQKHVMRIRMASVHCTLDAGGLRVVWLTGVKPGESAALLTPFVTGKSTLTSEGEDLREQALGAIAQHADPSADRILASFLAQDQPASLREKTSFWLGASRGKSGLALLETMAKNDPDPDVRAKVVFALFVSHEPEAVDDIIHMAKDDESTHVRGQALFWLAQKAGQKASATITGAIQNDPDTEVKKKAVFALSQMPKDEGVPKLIEVAQNNRNPEVRKQAMFWLGQSNDPRALAFFEKILSQ